MGRIMIVDDSRLARTFTSACLSKTGHQVEEVEPTSLFDVVKLVKASVPDLLIMDFLMPQCPGTSLARVCLPLPDETIVLSGHGPATTIGAERGSNPFLAGLVPDRGPARGL